MTKDYFYRSWLEHYASDISPADIEKYVVSTGNFIWHIFSWELKSPETYLAGDEARAAFDSVSKENAVYLQWFTDENTNKLPEDLKASALDEMMEVYVAAEDFSWTYIKTHEDVCGPYFMKK